jgi:hypothetical protein
VVSGRFSCPPPVHSPRRPTAGPSTGLQNISISSLCQIEVPHYKPLSMSPVEGRIDMGKNSSDVQHDRAQHLSWKTLPFKLRRKSCKEEHLEEWTGCRMDAEQFTLHMPRPMTALQEANNMAFSPIKLHTIFSTLFTPFNYYSNQALPLPISKSTVSSYPAISLPPTNASSKWRR